MIALEGGERRRVEVVLLYCDGVGETREIERKRERERDQRVFV